LVDFLRGTIQPHDRVESLMSVLTVFQKKRYPNISSLVCGISRNFRPDTAEKVRLYNAMVWVLKFISIVKWHSPCKIISTCVFYFIFRYLYCWDSC